jgi:hypothetical protein
MLGRLLPSFLVTGALLFVALVPALRLLTVPKLLTCSILDPEIQLAISSMFETRALLQLDALGDTGLRDAIMENRLVLASVKDMLNWGQRKRVHANRRVVFGHIAIAFLYRGEARRRGMDIGSGTDIGMKVARMVFPCVSVDVWEAYLKPSCIFDSAC